MVQSDIAVVGLGVMGKSLLLNLLDHRFNASGFDINADFRIRAKQEATALGKGEFTKVDSLESLLASLKTPRIIMLSVPAGKVVDDVINSLLKAGLLPDDIVIDTGNSLWTDSESREHQYCGRLRFFSTAVSGGEEGARYGPALMASGCESAWHFIKPIWEAIAAKVDGQGLPTSGFSDGEPCAAYLGPAGAGHYVKMVHNGIEYADMQIICEAYHFMSSALGMSAQAIGKTFSEWNQGVLNSYLMEISADILSELDPKTGLPFVEIVLDKAAQKGTGMWTAINSLQEGIPAPTIAQSVFSRAQSALKKQRVKASQNLTLPTQELSEEDCANALCDLEHALYCAKVSIYAQGFALMKAKSDKENWQLDLSKVARIWRAGCIIRAGILHQIALGFAQEENTDHLLFSTPFADALKERSMAWRRTLSTAILAGIPFSAMSSALEYVDMLRTEVLPANLLQAQRDYFGSHTYARVDEDDTRAFHFTWNRYPRTEQAL